jgi:hypothetical protein
MTTERGGITFGIFDPGTDRHCCVFFVRRMMIHCLPEHSIISRLAESRLKSSRCADGCFELRVIGVWHRRRELAFVLDRRFVQLIPADVLALLVVSVNVSPTMPRSVKLVSCDI